MNLRALNELDVVGKSVLVRTDFNVPLQNGKIRDDFRIRAALPTLEYLVRRAAKVVIITHLGRPYKSRGDWENKFSLEPVASHLAEIMKRKFIVVGDEQTTLPEYDVPHLFFFKHNLEETDPAPVLSQMRGGDIAVLENLRFYQCELEESEDFAKRLAALGSVYINEAFSASHRSHTSMKLLPTLLPAAGGIFLQREISSLERILLHPKTPMVVMLGGVKLETKAPVILNLARTTKSFLLGGGVANLFLRERGFAIGKSVSDIKEQATAKQILRDLADKIKLPSDAVVSTSYDGSASCVPVASVKANQMILDIGPETIRQYSEILRHGQTLVWNGPMGHFEQRQFSHGTKALARFFASRTKTDVYGLAGGGETLEVINQEGLARSIDHVSTGGGAMLDFLAGKSLPALEVLQK